MSTTPLFGMTELEADQANAHVLVNTMARILEAGVCLSVIAQQGAPPGSPADGDLYFISGSGSGAWSGHTNEFAVYSPGGWLFFPPGEGCEFFDQNLGKYQRWNGSSIEDPASTGVISKGPTNTQIIFGRVSDSGGIKSGTDFTVVKEVLGGRFTVNFTTAFGGTPTVVPTTEEDIGVFGSTHASSFSPAAGSCQIHTTNVLGGAYLDFAFVAFGPAA